MIKIENIELDFFEGFACGYTLTYMNIHYLDKVYEEVIFIL